MTIVTTLDVSFSYRIYHYLKKKNVYFFEFIVIMLLLLDGKL